MSFWRDLPLLNNYYSWTVSTRLFIRAVFMKTAGYGLLFRRLVTSYPAKSLLWSSSTCDASSVRRLGVRRLRVLRKTEEASSSSRWRFLWFFWNQFSFAVLVDLVDWQARYRADWSFWTSFSSSSFEIGKKTDRRSFFPEREASRLSVDDKVSTPKRIPTYPRRKETVKKKSVC